MHGQVQQHHARPEQHAARARDVMHALAAHEQHDGHQEGGHQRGRELPGYEPFETVHAGHPENADGGVAGSGRNTQPGRL